VNIEQQVFKDFTRGSEKAFSTLHDQYQKAIKGYINVHCFGPLKQKVADIEQETWCKIWEKRVQFDTVRSFYCFVCYWANIMIKRQVDAGIDTIPLDKAEDNHALMAQEAEFYRDTDKIESLFRITFTIGGPPHQLITFGFNKLLSQWNPRTIVSELSTLNLGQLLHILIKDYISASLLPEDDVYSHFWPLTVRMNKLVKDVLEEDTSRILNKEILFKSVQDTKLKEYFGSDPVHNISDWTYKVRTRVSRYFHKILKEERENLSLKTVL